MADVVVTDEDFAAACMGRGVNWDDLKRSAENCALAREWAANVNEQQLLLEQLVNSDDPAESSRLRERIKGLREKNGALREHRLKER